MSLSLLSLRLLQRANRVVVVVAAATSASRKCRQRDSISRSFHTSSTRGNSSSVAAIERGVAKLRIYDEIDLLAADLDWHYLLDKANLERIAQNIQERKSTGDIASLVERSERKFSNLS